MTAVVVLKPGQTTTGDNQIAHARQHLARYKPQIHRRDRFPRQEPERQDSQTRLSRPNAHLANETRTPA